jgi:hypothetical protein
VDTSARRNLRDMDPIRSYRYTVAMFPLPNKNVLKVPHAAKCGRHFHLSFQYKMYQRVPPTF